jgi:hypothetical protein
LCKAARYRYENSNMEDLELQLIRANELGARFKLIVTDGVFHFGSKRQSKNKDSIISRSFKRTFGQSNRGFCQNRESFNGHLEINCSLINCFFNILFCS